MRKLTVLLCLCLGWAANAEELDGFEALDAQLEAQFTDLDQELEAQYQALDQALENAYKRLAEEVSREWGEEEVELPTKSEWVDYSEDKQLRRKINFEEGVVEVEHLVDEGDDFEVIAGNLHAAAEEIATDNLADLADKDQALKYARQELEEQGIPVEQQAPHDDSAVVGKVMEKVPTQAELAKMVREARETRKLAGDKSKARATVTKLANNKQKVTVQVPLRLGHLTSLASKYQQAVIKEARRQDLPPSLVYAIMETESHFNPRARSHIPAFGLMQLVPRSGGVDAYNHVYGEKIILDPEYFYDPNQNVELGAAYLNLVFTRYLRHIDNEESRQLCTIAAYNTGAGNVAKSFVGTTNARKASEVINTMTPEQVYDHLVENLPYEETRRYLQKVTKAMKKYEALDQHASI